VKKLLLTSIAALFVATGTLRSNAIRTTAICLSFAGGARGAGADTRYRSSWACSRRASVA
jgi:hypothetical protein